MKKTTPTTHQVNNAGKNLLEKAYLLDSPDDNISYYNKMAASYDKDFADNLGYALPQLVAEQFLSLATTTDTPVVDIGCGTGLLGQALSSNTTELDGMDISSAMLQYTREGNKYRNLFEVDLTKDISAFKNRYRAVLSSGTFTHGHLGPDPLVRLIDIALPNALFVIAVNRAHYETTGFETALKGLISSRTIINFLARPVDIYKGSDHAHSNDKGLLLSFRKQ